MFREMRRFKQLMSEEETEAVMKRGNHGVLAVAGDEGYPYAVPVSYVYNDHKIYFHCAVSGHKLDAINQCDKVSFCVVDDDHIVPSEYTTYFRSAIAFGKARILEGDEKRAAATLIGERYSSEYREGYLAEIEETFNRLCVVEILVEHLTGKEAMEYVNAKA